MYVYIKHLDLTVNDEDDVIIDYPRGNRVRINRVKLVECKEDSCKNNVYGGTCKVRHFVEGERGSWCLHPEILNITIIERRSFLSSVNKVTEI